MNKTPPAISRRDFARRTVLASAAVTLLPSAGRGEQQAPASAPAPSETTEPKLSVASQAEVDSRIQTVLAQYGDRLNDAQKADIRRLCAATQPGLDRLRAYEVKNGDGSSLYLKPLLEHDKPPSQTRVKSPATVTKKP